MPVYDMTVEGSHNFIANGVVVHNSGKTEIGADIVRRLGLPTLWLVNKQDLLTQTAERLATRLGQPVGMIGAGCWNDQEDVVIGMVQTLSRAKIELRQPYDHKSWWERWRVLVLDECHHGSADTWEKVVQQCVNAPWRYGLSATPLTGDPLRDAKLEGATGPLITVRTITELVEAGFLAKPRIVMLRPPAESYPTYETVRAAVLPDWRDNPTRLRKMGGRLYAEAYRRGVTENRDRTERITEKVIRHAVAGEKVLVLCTLLAHGAGMTGKIIERWEYERKMGAALGVLPAVWWLDGSDRLDDRKATLEKFKAWPSGAVIVASTIFQEGLDVPELDVLILAGGGRSDLTTLQRVGRALRRRPDKQEVLIYDVKDGRGTWAPKDYLAQHTAERLATYAREGFEVTGAGEGGK
jgi:superfamily II DNA or RNA helicase